MSTSGAQQYTPVRILSVIAAAELSVGGLGSESLADRVRRLSNSSSQHAEAAASAGRSLLGALGLRALEVEPALAESVSAVLEAQSPGATAAWVVSLEERGGTAPGTSLGSLAGALRRAAAAGPAPGPAVKSPEPGLSEPTPLAVATPSASSADASGSLAPSAELIELTFEDNWIEEDAHELLPDDTVSDDLEIADGSEDSEEIEEADEVDDIELEDDDEDDGPLLTDEAIDDLLADDSVDLDDDGMDEGPVT
jgi:hypothetical protein